MVTITSSLIASEIKALQVHNLIVSQGQFRVYCASADQIPGTLREIGRLREITFREVGEGTGLEYDIDRYDAYYKQLIIWDAEAERIVGGYRLTDGGKTIRERGVAGLYLNSLFRFHRDFHPVLETCLELGRSYIIPEYQKQRLPLFLLWKGIVHYLAENPENRYLVGPVSISKYYSGISKSVMVAFVKRHYFLPGFASYIKPRTPYRPELKQVDISQILRELNGNLQKLDNFIEEIEPDHFRLPVLLKQYIRQNARFIGFNLDPNFNDALDGLMILDLENARKETLERLKRSL